MKTPLRAAGLAALLCAPGPAPAQAPKNDPLSSYTVCVTAAYAELIVRFPDPVESMVRSRIACQALRDALGRDLRRRAGASTPEVLNRIDVEILKSLRD